MSDFTTAFKNQLLFYQIPIFTATGLVRHGFTTRGGGVSTGVYASLNTAFHVGDAPENVRANRVLACDALGVNPDDLVAGRQVHGDRVAVVGNSDRGRGARTWEEALPDVDALITATPGVPLSSYYADCVPVFLLDPVQKVVALAHAGWKGTAAQIAFKTVRKMAAVFRTDPKDCLAGVGPSIGPCCYEVSETVIESMQNNYPDWTDLVTPAGGQKWRLNLWEANYRSLLKAGLAAGNIAVAGICTACRNDLFFSYRAQGGAAGRMASLIMLR